MHLGIDPYGPQREARCILPTVSSQGVPLNTGLVVTAVLRLTLHLAVIPDSLLTAIAYT